MLISPFSPVFFLGSRKSCGGECPFTQFFAKGDSIYIQVIRTADEQSCQCILKRMTDNGSSVVSSLAVACDSSQVGDVCVDGYTIPLTVDGYHYISIGDEDSEPFDVTSDESAISESVLFEYSPSDNTVRCDVVPIIDGIRKWFSFRVPGGFKESGYNFSVDNEQFSTQSADLVDLYAIESVQETLTVGWNRGVPIWFGQLINRLLTCKYVYIDGLRYARYGSSVPEKEQTTPGVNGFIFSQKLQRIYHLEPTK